MNTEDKTYENDELEANHTRNEDDSDTESHDAEGETSEQSDDRTYTAADLERIREETRKEQDRRWKERIKGIQGKEGSDEGSQENRAPEKVASNDALLARLEARGVTEREDQQWLIKAAEREGSHPVDLLNDEYFKDRLAARKTEREQKAATPPPTNRNATTDRSKDVGYWVDQAKKGVSAPTAEMRREVRKRLAGR